MMLVPFLLLLTAEPQAQQAANTPAVAQKATDEGDKIVCRRFTETGSLVKGYRTCKSKRDWERERQNAQVQNWSNGCGAIAEGKC